MAKPITPEEMTAYIEATWNKCQKEAWQEQEPVAWIVHEDGVRGLHWSHPRNGMLKVEPLYTAPPKKEWVGLTDEEIADVWKTEYFNISYELPRAVEAKLKEKNNG